MEEGLTFEEKAKIYNILQDFEQNYKFSNKWTEENDKKVKQMYKLINNFEFNKPNTNKGLIQRFKGKMPLFYLRFCKYLCYHRSGERFP